MTIEQTPGKGSSFNNSWPSSKLRHDELGVFLILSSLVSPFLFLFLVLCVEDHIVFSLKKYNR